jgi:ABC-type maltose transport system permease subunit
MWNYSGGYSILPGMMMLMMIGMIAAYIIFLIALWRLMRAHEKMADTVTEIFRHYKSPGSGGNKQ